ncbi:uncharacterized protein LOC135218410 [Macrobrachium nipponense]|uniref:uncharacterized protein LOC135218410 n=1 Tax=Macrobrachium nipponense TaxID=159736 RepID=UPI0030C7AC2D
MGCKCRLLPLTCLLLFTIDGRLTSGSPDVCPVTSMSIELKNAEHFLVHVPTSTQSVSFDFRPHNCTQSENVLLNSVPSVRHNAFVDEYGVKWLQITCGIKTGKLNVVVNGKVCTQGETTYSPDCDQNDFSIVFTSHVKVAKFCNGPPPAAADPFSTCENVDDFWRESDEKWSHTNGERRTYSTYSTSFRGGHVIFIPVGAILFLLSVCLRFCLCHRKKFVQRVRTVTVVRRVPVASQDFVHVTEPTSPDPTDLPPSYVDIENEVPPPPYSDVSASSSGLMTESLRDGQATDHSPSSSPGDHTPAENSTGTDSNVAEKDTRSTLSRMLAAAGSKSLKSQFSFRPMKEEEE